MFSIEISWQTPISTFVCFFFADPIREPITGNAAVPTSLASLTLALCSTLVFWLH